MTTSPSPAMTTTLPTLGAPARRTVTTAGLFTEVVQTAVISTAHLPLGDRAVLWRDTRYPIIARDPDPDAASVFLHVSEDPYFSEDGTRDPAEALLLDCSETVWELLDLARMAGITYVRFDRDAEINPALPVFPEGRYAVCGGWDHILVDGDAPATFRFVIDSTTDTVVVMQRLVNQRWRAATRMEQADVTESLEHNQFFENIETAQGGASADFVEPGDLTDTLPAWAVGAMRR